MVLVLAQVSTLPQAQALVQELAQAQALARLSLQLFFNFWLFFLAAGASSSGGAGGGVDPVPPKAPGGTAIADVAD